MVLHYGCRSDGVVLLAFPGPADHRRQIRDTVPRIGLRTEMVLEGICPCCEVLLIRRYHLENSVFGLVVAVVCRVRGHQPLAGCICARCLRPIRWFSGRWWTC